MSQQWSFPKNVSDLRLPNVWILVLPKVLVQWSLSIIVTNVNTQFLDWILHLKLKIRNLIHIKISWLKWIALIIQIIIIKVDMDNKTITKQKFWKS